MLVFCIFFQLLYCKGGGSCGGGPLYTLRVVTGYVGIVWKMGVASTIVGIRAGSCCGGGNISTLISNGVVNFGVDDVGLWRSGVAVWKTLSS